MKKNFFFSQHYLYDFNKTSQSAYEINILYNDCLKKLIYCERNIYIYIYRLQFIQDKNAIFTK